MDRWGWEQLDPWLSCAQHFRSERVLRSARPDARSSVGTRWCSLPAPYRGRPRRTCAAGCAASAAPRARRRNVARRRAAAGHPTPTRPCRSRDHLGVPTRNRQHRDRPRCPRAASANDRGQPRVEGRVVNRPRPGGSHAARAARADGSRPSCRFSRIDRASRHSSHSTRRRADRHASITHGFTAPRSPRQSRARSRQVVRPSCGSGSRRGRGRQAPDPPTSPR